MRQDSVHSLLQRGFTLIEMAIVIVIIGLLAGGVLVGKDLIDAANIRHDFSEMEKISTAVNTFKIKYGKLPGDLPNGQTFGFSSSADGDGNGRIEGENMANSPVYGLFAVANWGGSRPEWFYMFYHLAMAGLYNLNPYDPSDSANRFPGIAYPAMRSPSGGGFWDASACASGPTNNENGGIILGYENNTFVTGHWFRMNACAYQTNPYLSFYAAFNPSVAALIDKKFDDGQALTGIVRVSGMRHDAQCPDDIFSSGACPAGAIGVSGSYLHCVLDTTNNYDIGFDMRSCALRVKAGF